MADDELDRIRERKLKELQEAGQEAEQDAAREQMEAQKQALLRQILEPEARERLTRVRMARPEVAENLEQQLLVLARQGRIQSKIDDDTLKRFLSQITSNRRDISIERR